MIARSASGQSATTPQIIRASFSASAPLQVNPSILSQYCGSRAQVPPMKSSATAGDNPDPFDPDLLSRFVPPESIPLPFPGLYACFDKTDTPIYIGQSGHVQERLKEHRRKKWWPSVTHIRALPMANKDQILCAEAVLQLRYRPRYCRAIKLQICNDGSLVEIQFIRSK